MPRLPTYPRARVPGYSRTVAVDHRGLPRDKPYQTTAATLASPSEAIGRLDAGGRHLIKSPFVTEPNHLLDEGLLLLVVEAGK